MIIYLAGAIAHREQLYQDILSSRLYSYHYHKPGESFWKEFIFKMKANRKRTHRSSCSKPNISNSPKHVGIVEDDSNYPLLEIF